MIVSMYLELAGGFSLAEDHVYCEIFNMYPHPQQQKKKPKEKDKEARGGPKWGKRKNREDSVVLCQVDIR